MQEVNRKNIRFWSMLGQRGTICGVALPEIMQEDKNCYVVTADMGHTSGLDRVMQQYSDKFVNVGIAEQNLIGVASGIAFDGNTVVATTFATFLTMRCYEQIRHNLGYQKANVKLLGAMSGFAIGMFGNTHYSYEDMAIMRAIPNMIVISPADATEAYKAFYAAMKMDNPVYMRLSDGTNANIVYKEDYNFEIGKAVCLQEGQDAVVFATGGMVFECTEAAKILEMERITLTIINIHTIKPLDEEMLLQHIDAKLIITVEEHSVIGGLGGAVAEFYTKQEYSPRHVFMGIEDAFSEPGEQAYVKKINKLDAQGIAERIKKLVRNRVNISDNRGKLYGYNG